jgi:DNA-binding MarR family transcriptional regulator
MQQQNTCIVVSTTKEFHNLFKLMTMRSRFQVFPLRFSPGYLISRTALLMRTRLHQGFTSNGFDVTTDQWAVLNRLWEKEGIYQSQLADLTRKDRHSITRTLQIMERKDLIVRQSDTKDARRTLIFLSEKGRKLKEQLIPVVVQTLEEAFEGVTDQELVHLEEIHQKIQKNIEKENK